MPTNSVRFGSKFITVSPRCVTIYFDLVSRFTYECTTAYYDFSRWTYEQSRLRTISYDSRGLGYTEDPTTVQSPRLATIVLNTFKTIVAFPDSCRSSTVRPEWWQRRHERVTDISRFITISQIVDDRDERSGPCDWGLNERQLIFSEHLCLWEGVRPHPTNRHCKTAEITSEK